MEKGGSVMKREMCGICGCRGDTWENWMNECAHVRWSEEEKV